MKSTSVIVLVLQLLLILHGLPASAYTSCAEVWTSSSSTDQALLLDTSGMYALDGYGEQRCVFTQIEDIDQVFVGVMFESFSLQNKLSQRCTWVSGSNEDDCVSSEDSPNYDNFRWSNSRITASRSATMSAPQLFVTCNGQSATNSNEDYLLMPFVDELVTQTVAAMCLAVTSINVRGQGCPDTVAPFWADGTGNAGHGFHTDSSYYSTICPVADYPDKKTDAECLLNTGAGVEEDNFGHYNHPDADFQCSADASSTTNYFVGSLFDVPALTVAECQDYIAAQDSVPSWWITAVAGLLAALLALNVVLMCYVNCCRVSFNKARRSGYGRVKVIDSEADDINVVASE